MVWNDKLKRSIPSGWSSENILSTCEVRVGGTPSKAVPAYWEKGNIPFFSPTDVSENIYQVSTENQITLEGLNHCASPLLQTDDIVLTARGSIGKLVIVGEPMAMNQSCYALTPKFSNTPYLYFLSKELIEWLKAKGSGSVFKSFTIKDIEASVLCSPPRGLIKKYCQNVSPIFDEIKRNTKETLVLIEYREKLLPLLMNGQVSFKPPEVNCDLVLAVMPFDRPIL